MFRRENIELDVWGLFNHLILILIQVSDSSIKAATVAAFLKDCGQYSMLQVCGLHNYLMDKGLHKITRL